MGKTKSQFPSLSPTTPLSESPELWFVTSVSVWGWKAEENFGYGPKSI